jgi:hypothetical protein
MPKGEEWRAAVAAEPGPDQEGQIRRGGDDAADVQVPGLAPLQGDGRRQRRIKLRVLNGMTVDGPLPSPRAVYVSGPFAVRL